ncbi:hypothetical protein O181_035816 [Austropuccinia psidii MF-1]|uniref:Uncharacterized protein n=1 Tax=Austropuccinia psidii MF-1 TaxID=1389203 RepID=A0A9Q3D902_9BASI|nr:hypothetical protein [Austropuccinia psidii MF-1]
MTAETWTPISIQRNRKQQNFSSMKGKPTLTTFTGKITVINPVVTSKGKFSKAAEKNFLQGTVKETLASKGTSQSTEKDCLEPEDLEEDTLATVVDSKRLRQIIPTLPFTFQLNRNLKPEVWKDMDQVLQLHQLLKDLFQWSIEKKRFNLSSHWEELGASFQKVCIKQRDFKDLMVITKGWNSNRKIILLEISGQESPFFTIPGIFQENTRIQGPKQDHLQPKEERVRPNYPEAVGFGNRSAQEPELVVHYSRISSPININITPNQIEHNVVTPESNSNSDALCLQMSQYADQTKKKFAELEASHERMKKLTASMDKIVKTLQEGHYKWRKASEETNKRLNLVLEEQHHIKRDRDFIDQEINKQFNVYHNMKPQLWIIHITKMKSNQIPC